MKRSTFHPGAASSALVLAGIATLLPAQGIWVRGRALPPYGAQIAYDTARERLVAFGVDLRRAAGGVSQLWEWTGTSWERRESAHHPSWRVGAALVYDPVRRHVLLFGGAAGSGLAFQDTWTWNGYEWTLLQPATSPPPRVWHALAFDGQRQRVVLFGGSDASNRLLDDTWEWDGGNWIQRTPAVRPAARALHPLAYHAGTRRTLLFGGQLAGGPVANDTWEWDGTQWIQKHPARSPVARHAPAMAYDPLRDRTVLFGGAFDVIPTDDTWEWDGATWQPCTPPANPGGRTLAGMAFDAGARRLVLHGGTDRYGREPRDTWSWDGGGWRLEVPPGSPGQLGGATLAYHAARGTTLVLLVEPGYPMGLATWTWDGVRWSRRDTPPGLADRRQMAVAYDETRQRVVLFGGVGLSNGTRLADTWEWDGNAWTEALPARRPPARDLAAMAYHRPSRRVVLFGGSGPRDDTWEWDGNAWTERLPAARPPARDSAAMAIDPAQGHTLLFGGLGGAGPLGDTWLWDGSGWTQSNPASRPSARYLHAMALADARGRVVLFGGIGAVGGLATDDTWEWDGAAWTPVTTGLRPPAAAGHGMAYDRGRGRIASYVDQLWHYGDLVPAELAHTGRGCLGTSPGPFVTASVPELGSPGFCMDLVHARPSAASAIGIAAKTQTLALGTCTYYLDAPPVMLGLLTSATGFGTLRIGVPDDPTLRGVILYGQGFVADPAGGFAGVAFTPALRLTLGD
ncbi:MAG: hypothetical protein IT458_04620 [Planctomycetes bacterium]|nr:hypothetical protein [Planctomycetota bacterium]